MSAPVYSVTLHHLSADATSAGLSYPDEQILAVNIDQLRALFYAFSLVASELTIYEPSTPEIRVKTDRDVFIVRTRYRRLCLVGWETILRGEDHTVAYILTAITGNVEPVKPVPTKAERTGSASPMGSTPPLETERFPRWAKIATMVVLIIVFNAITAWMLLKPPASLVPKNVSMASSDSRSLLTKYAGVYETGRQPGDRRLVLDADGTLRLAKYGAQEAVVQERLKTAEGTLVDGRAAFVTSEPGLITIKDADTLVYFNTTYKRRQP